MMLMMMVLLMMIMRLCNVLVAYRSLVVETGLEGDRRDSCMRSDGYVNCKQLHEMCLTSTAALYNVALHIGW